MFLHVETQRKENKTKEKQREENDMDSLLSIDEYEKMFPDKNVSQSLKKKLTMLTNQITRERLIG